MLKNAIMAFSVLLPVFSQAVYAGGVPAEIEREEARRASLELDNIRDLIESKRTPPIAFESDSAELKISSYKTLDLVAGVLKRYPKMKLVVEGHTDDVGPYDYNERLSLLRAGAVKTYLSFKGVHPDSIRVLGFGESRPAVEGTSPEARALNRRVEMYITTRDWNTVF